MITHEHTFMVLVKTHFVPDVVLGISLFLGLIGYSSPHILPPVRYLTFRSELSCPDDHMPMSCLVVLLFTFNRQLLEVDLNICHIWTLIYHETSQCDSTKKKKNDMLHASASLSDVVMDRLMLSGLWVEQTVVTLSVNGTRRESLPAEGHQCLSTWAWPFGGPGQGRHASNSWVRMMGVRPQHTSKPRQASDSWMTLNLKLRRICQLSSSLFVVKHIFHKLQWHILQDVKVLGIAFMINNVYSIQTHHL